MSLSRSVLPTLALTMVAPFLLAPHYKSLDTVSFNYHGQGLLLDCQVVVVVPDSAGAVAVLAELRSDAGDEDVTLVESDAWLHGAAAIKALPKSEATVALTLYDKSSAKLGHYAGVLDAEGGISLSADPSTDAEAKLDVEVLAAEVFAAGGSYDVSFDLAGADVYSVAYAELALTESTKVTTCDKVTGCTTTGSSTTSTSEVGWDETGAVWKATLDAAPEGVVEVKVKAYGTDGDKLETAKVKLAAPWVDGGDGLNALALDEDPLTTVAVVSRKRLKKVIDGDDKIYVSVRGLAVASEGWSVDDTLPVDAQVELTNGDTITIPVNSYQRPVKPDMYVEDIRFVYGTGVSWRITVNGSSFDAVDGSVRGAELEEPVCDNGTCVSVSEGDAGYNLSVTVYGATASKLPDEATVVLTELDEKGGELDSEAWFIEFDEEITAVFANEVSFAADPVGLDLAGKVKLLGAANKKGKQSTLAKGKFYGRVARDGEGDLGLSGADKDTVTSSGSVVVAGDPIGFELTTDDNKDGELNPPPVLAFGVGGRITKIVVSSGGLDYSI